MKAIQFSCVVAVLIWTGTVSASLLVHEFIPHSGELVTLDGLTGNYWYWNLDDFELMTYGDQITVIAGLGTYGNIAGGWHMATRAEMDALWDNYSATELAAAFAHTSEWMGEEWYTSGRYDQFCKNDWHHVGHISYSYTTQLWARQPLGFTPWPDAQAVDYYGAWVVTDHEVIPVPPAAILAAIGLLSSLGLKRLRRKHQE